MGFSGSVPETVNGRLAMLGFVAAIAAELNSGEFLVQGMHNNVLMVPALRVTWLMQQYQVLVHCENPSYKYVKVPVVNLHSYVSQVIPNDASSPFFQLLHVQLGVISCLYVQPLTTLFPVCVQVSLCSSSGLRSLLVWPSPSCSSSPPA